MRGQWSHLYSTPRWRRLRAAHLRAHPWCVMCLERGEYTHASVVDHKRPHRGDTRLFFDAGNLQAPCKPHHDSTKQWEEHHGMTRGCDADGNPRCGHGRAGRRGPRVGAHMVTPVWGPVERRKIPGGPCTRCVRSA